MDHAFNKSGNNSISGFDQSASLVFSIPVSSSIRQTSPRGEPRGLGSAQAATFRVRRVVSPPLSSIHGASNGASRTQVDLLAKLSRHKGGKCGYAWGCFLSVFRGGLGNLIYQPIFHGYRREEFPAATLEMRASSYREGSIRPILFAKYRRFGIPQRLTNGGFKIFLGLIVYKHRHGSILSVRAAGSSVPGAAYPVDGAGSPVSPILRIDPVPPATWQRLTWLRR